ncbi:MAG: (deoxy)nucleoside triphosphate pyrophosphohydrolase [Polyangiaceae bacterium]
MSADDERPTVRVVGAAIVDGPRVLVARRSPAMSSPNRWEFPGGKVEEGETHAEALRRELAEELGVEVVVGEHVGTGRARSAGGDVIVLDVYRATLKQGRPTPREHAELRWVDATALATLDWADADVPIVPAVAALVGGQGPRSSTAPYSSS